MMTKNRINVTKWKEFTYNDFFELINDGNKLSNKDLSDSGKIPVYSSSTVNNGIFGYTDKKPDYIINDENPLYLIFGDHTKSMFIVKSSFSVMDNVKVLIPKIFNEYCIRFITTVWQKKIPNIGYARHWSIAKNIMIPLPVDINNKPDFDYMESYMKSIEEKAGNSFDVFNNKVIKLNMVNIEKWKEFRIGDLFDIHPTKAYKLNNRYLFVEDGINPVVVNSCQNNGVGGFTNNECTENANMITFSDTTSADSIFYHNNKFVGYPHVQGLYPIGKYKSEWDEYTYLFFVTLFRTKAINLNYDYVNKFTRESAKEIMIKLPVDDNGGPDFNYMREFMKACFGSTRKKLALLQQI